jgi:hypothetical protein
MYLVFSVFTSRPTSLLASIATGNNYMYFVHMLQHVDLEVEGKWRRLPECRRHERSHGVCADGKNE